MHLRHTACLSLAVLFSLTCLEVKAAQAPWQEAAAPARFVIDLDKPETAGKVSWIRLCLPDPTWSELPLVAYNEKDVRIGAKVLWSAPGEPATILFDSSSGVKRYFLYFGKIPLPPPPPPVASLTPPPPPPPTPPPWNPESGVLLETRAGEGKEIRTWDEMIEAWNKSSTVLGRSLITTIFEGGHRHGPQANILSYYKGWFDVPAAATYSFTTTSTDASFLLIDGKQVVAWPGNHHFNGGTHGEFRGSVDLTAGAHVIEYYNSYTYRNEGRPPILCCIAVKAGNEGWAVPFPDNNTFFRPISHAHVAGYELIPKEIRATSLAAGLKLPEAPAIGFEWDTVEQSVPTSESTQTGFILTRLRYYRHWQEGKYTWNFDDGSTGDGAKLEHLYLSPGVRQVKLTALNKEGKEIGSLTLPVFIHPNWTQLTTRRPELMPKHRDLLLKRDPATITSADLPSVISMLQVYEDIEGLVKLTPLIVSRMNDLPEDSLPTLRKAALLLTTGPVKRPTEAQQLHQALVDRTSTGSASPSIKSLAYASRLSLAQILLRTTNRTDDVAKLLGAIDLSALSKDDRRALDLLRADLALATGNVEDAKKKYQALTGEPTDVDARSSMRRMAKIEQANSFLDKKDFESAEKALWEIEWSAPIEKIAPDFAVARTRLEQERGESQVALLWARRVLPAITAANARSSLLFRITELSFAQNDAETARKTLAELLQKYPYSEGTAKAKTKWPNEITSKK